MLLDGISVWFGSARRWMVGPKAYWIPRLSFHGQFLVRSQAMLMQAAQYQCQRLRERPPGPWRLRRGRAE